jgi:hypothetical protein
VIVEREEVLLVKPELCIEASEDESWENFVNTHVLDAIRKPAFYGNETVNYDDVVAI